MTINQGSLLDNPQDENRAGVASDLPVLSALAFINGLKTYLHVESQPGGGWLVECPLCFSLRQGGLLVSVRQIGQEFVVGCYGCSDEPMLIEGLITAGGAAPLVGKHQWLERELSRGIFERSALLELLGKKLPVPHELRPNPIPQAIHTKEFLALKAPPRVELCGPWLREQTITEVYGWRGAGKSWFCLHLAYCVAAGVDFMRWSVKTPTRVVYVDGEMGLDDMQGRLQKIIESEEKKAGRALDFELYHLSDSNLAQFPDGLPKLSTPEGRALIEAQLSHGPTLLILDNLSILFNSAIENDAESWCEAQDWLISLRRRGHSIIFVHHAGKGGAQRGTSKREDACNNVIALKQPEDHQAEDGAAFTLKFEKSRGVHGPAVSSFDAKLTEDEHGALTWATSTSQSAQMMEIRERRDAGATYREIAKACGVGLATVKRALDKTSPKEPTSSHPVDRSAGGLFRVPPPMKGGAEHQNIQEPGAGTESGTESGTKTQIPLIASTLEAKQRNSSGTESGTRPEQRAEQRAEQSRNSGTAARNTLQEVRRVVPLPVPGVNIEASPG
jgi:AAA domain